ncbi:MAG: sensor histidine kinase, partial [Alphaproteobacteria bacterium]
MNGSQDDADGSASAILVFGADGRLADWSPAAEALPYLAGCLAAGMPAADLEEQAWPGRKVVPMAGGGAVWRLANLASSTVSSSASADTSTPVTVAQPMRDPAGRLFAAASHDLRQPLAALSLLIGTLDGRLKEGRTGAAERSGRDLLHSMAQAVESMRNMVDGHFDLVRLESGLVEPDIRTHAVNGVLMRLALDVAPRFADRGVRFSVMPCSAMVRTDSALLERLLHGLVANALRVTAHGRVLVGCRTRGDRLRIEVWDSGRGLSA